MSSDVVVGTAGHVDHGKTALVLALTGTDCDRLPEEKARGISIELGFARWPLGPGRSAGVVDVPGHERFVQTMIAGASGIDRVLLIVAADDGVMPQTREHLAICDLLGVGGGVVAITKADLADDETLELVREDVRCAVAGTFLEAADVVACSTRDGRGLLELTAALVRTLRAPERAGPTSALASAPFLPIDRVFSKPGFGTVVTGTLARGRIAVGDVLEAMPTPERGGGGGVVEVRVRGISVHGEPRDAAVASTRVALNVRGAADGELRRGGALVAPGWQVPTRAIDVAMRLVPGAPTPEPRTELVLHLGTEHRTVRARLLGDGIVRLTSAAPFVAFAGQRLILRRPDLGLRTIGGGTVLDPHPRGRPKAGRAHPALLAPRERLLAFVAESRDGMARADLVRRLPPDAGAAENLDRLVKEGELFAAEADGATRYFARALLERAEASIASELLAFHAHHPALAGASASELESKLPAHLRPLATMAVARSVAKGAIVREDGRLRSRDHQAAGAARIVEYYERAALGPSSDGAVAQSLGLDGTTFRDITRELKRRGQLHALAGLHFHAGALEKLEQTIADRFRSHAELRPTDLKEVCGLTRKHAIPLLEWLDARGITRRQGEVRVAGPAAIRRVADRVG